MIQHEFFTTKSATKAYASSFTWGDFVVLAAILIAPIALWLFATGLVNAMKSDHLLAYIQLISERARGHYAIRGYPSTPQPANAVFIAHNLIPERLIADTRSAQIKDPWDHILTLSYSPRSGIAVPTLSVTTSLDRATCLTVVHKATPIISSSTFSLRIASLRFTAPPRTTALHLLCTSTDTEVAFEIPLTPPIAPAIP